MNTEVEQALLVVAQEGTRWGGDVASPVGWFAVAEVRASDEEWLSDQYDLPLPDPGHYMVVVGEDGTIVTMRAEPQECSRWYDLCQNSFTEWKDQRED